MAHDKEYVQALAEATVELFAEGVNDPSATEIAEKYFPDKWLGGETIDGVRKRLSLIRSHLEQHYAEVVCLVSETYYVRFRETPPTTVADARRCLPVGHAVKKWGVRRYAGEDDLIWQEAIRLGFATGAGTMKKFADRALVAYEGHQLSEEAASRLLTEAQGLARPDHPEIAAHLLEALPSVGVAEEGDE